MSLIQLRLLKPWSDYKPGKIVTATDTTAEALLNEGIAEIYVEPEPEPEPIDPSVVERAVMPPAEQAVAPAQEPTRRRGRRPKGIARGTESDTSAQI